MFVDSNLKEFTGNFFVDLNDTFCLRINNNYWYRSKTKKKRILFRSIMKRKQQLLLTSFKRNHSSCWDSRACNSGHKSSVIDVQNQILRNWISVALDFFFFFGGFWVTINFLLDNGLKRTLFLIRQKQTVFIIK